MSLSIICRDLRVKLNRLRVLILMVFALFSASIIAPPMSYFFDKFEWYLLVPPLPFLILLIALIRRRAIVLGLLYRAEMFLPLGTASADALMSVIEKQNS